MNILSFKPNFADNERDSGLLLAFENVEITEHNVEVFFAVIKHSTTQTASKNEELMRENKELFAERNRLMMEVIRLESEVDKLKFIIATLQNHSDSSSEPIKIVSHVPNTSFKAKLQDFIKNEKIKDALECFLDEAKKNGSDDQDELLLLSSRFTRIEKNERKGIIDSSEANNDRNKINSSLIELIGKLKT